jgi:fucose permease
VCLCLRRYLVSFCVLASLLLLWALIAALLDLLLEDLGESLESCLRRVSFVLPSYFLAFVLALINCLIS